MKPMQLKIKQQWNKPPNPADNVKFPNLALAAGANPPNLYSSLTAHQFLKALNMLITN